MQESPSQSAARANIRRALELRNKSSFDVSVTLGKNRTYLDDFLRNRKQSISGRFKSQLASLLNVHESYLNGHDDLPVSVEHIIGAEGHPNKLRVLDRRISEIDFLLEVSKKNSRGFFGKKIDSDENFEGIFGIRDSLIKEREWLLENKGKHRNSNERIDWVFPDAFMRDQLKVNDEEIAVFPVNDTSMTRDTGLGFHVGDHIIISKRSFDLRLGGLFLISSDQSLFVRQVELLEDSSPLRVRCRAYNSDYPTFDLEIGGKVRVLGKAVATIKML